MDPQTNILAKVRSFFKDDVDLSSISKPSDVLDLPFNMLKVWDASWEPFFEELDLVSIKDLAQYQDPLVF
ncbi:MAG: hypothetical protein ACTSUK_08190, partial [Promethearchaeota archaeon]